MLSMYNVLVYIISLIPFGAAFKDGCIQPNCTKLTFTEACSSCRSDGGEMLSYSLLATIQPNVTAKAFESMKGSTLWISQKDNCSMEEQHKDNCTVFDFSEGKGSMDQRSCSQESRFLCFFKNSNCSNVTCFTDEEEMAMGLSKTTIVIIATTVPLSLALLANALCCFIFIRFRKPKKYAVRVESAAYRSKNQDTETENEDNVYSNFDFALSY